MACSNSFPALLTVVGDELKKVENQQQGPSVLAACSKPGGLPVPAGGLAGAACLPLFEPPESAAVSAPDFCPPQTTLQSDSDTGESCARQFSSASPPRCTSGAADSKKRSSSPIAEVAQGKKQKLTGFAARHSGTSSYRGVSWHTQTGRWKAQIKVGGKDVNLGRHREEEDAARAYDRAAICARGLKEAKLNFPGSDYVDVVAKLRATPLETLAAELRGVEERLSAQTSRYHGVRLNKRTTKWEAYIRVAGKHVHLGCHQCETSAAQAFDQAAIVRHAHHLGAVGGKPAIVTNFPIAFYQGVLSSMLSNALAAQGGGEAVAEDAAGRPFRPLKDKYLNNLLTKCQQQGGVVTPATTA